MYAKMRKQIQVNLESKLSKVSRTYAEDLIAEAIEISCMDHNVFIEELGDIFQHDKELWRDIRFDAECIIEEEIKAVTWQPRDWVTVGLAALLFGR